MVETPDVAIVGGGIIGCAIAWHLAERGIERVAILEKAKLASGATGICPGGVRQQFEGEADCVIARHSVRFFERINEILRPEMPFVFERSGYLFLADSSAVLDRFRRNVATQNGLGIPTRLLGPDEIAAFLPSLRLEGVVGGTLCLEDGFLEDCHGITNLLAVRARERGARVIYEEATRLSRISAGWQITTAAGSRIHAAHVVLAGGVDSLPLAAQAGLALPVVYQRRRLAYTIATEPGLMPPLVVAPEREFAGKQLTSGVFYLGWLRETEDVDDLTFIERALQSGSTLLPALAELPVRRVMSGPYDTTPDRRPILGAVDGLEGLHLAVGFSGHGFMIAPAVGEMLAAAIAGKKTALPLDAFSLARFAASPAEEGLVI